jgi:hypothetical protein
MDTVHKTLRPLTYENSPAELWDVLGYCDHVGLLTRRGYLEVRDVWSEFGPWFFNYYADGLKVIEEDRKASPASMKECTWLIETMRPIEVQEDRGKDANPTSGDIYEFYDSERAAEPGRRSKR